MVAVRRWRKVVGVLVLVVLVHVVTLLNGASPYNWASGTKEGASRVQKGLTGTQPSQDPHKVPQQAKDVVQENGKRQAASTPMVVLVVSSMPRSGSTLLTELLSTIQDSVTFFEPLWPMQRKPRCIGNSTCVGKFMEGVFNCNFSDEFENWLKAKSLFFSYFNPEAQRCVASQRKEDMTKCVKNMKLRELCEAAPVLVVKVIRARLSWFTNLLADTFINLRIIHLVRDPRGAINSIRRFGWDEEPVSRCGDLWEDMQAFDSLIKRFPSSVMQVNYEKLCLEPQVTTGRIFQFLFGDPGLPREVSDFLNSHMLREVGPISPLNTYKNSNKAFQEWRFTIPTKYLEKIENEPSCLSAIECIGHTVFRSKTNLLNSSIPLIKH